MGRKKVKRSEEQKKRVRFIAAWDQFRALIRDRREKLELNRRQMLHILDSHDVVYEGTGTDLRYVILELADRQAFPRIRMLSYEPK